MQDLDGLSGANHCYVLLLLAAWVYLVSHTNNYINALVDI